MSRYFSCASVSAPEAAGATVGEGVGAGVTAGLGVGAPLGGGVTGWIVALIAVADAIGSAVGLPGAPTPDAARSPHAAVASTSTARRASRPISLERWAGRKVPRTAAYPHRGALAQRSERLLYTQRVGGSNPPGPTRRSS